MAVPLLKRKSPVGVNLNSADRENVAKILEAHNLPPEISNSEFLRKVFEIAANPSPESSNADCTEHTDKITELENQLQIALQGLEDAHAQPTNPELENKIRTLEAENTKLSAQLITKQEPPTEEPAPENIVRLPVSEKMQKALKIRKRAGKSENMNELVQQAVSFCINRPLATVFTTAW